MATKRMTGAEAAISSLEAHDVDAIFGIPGEHCLPNGSGDNRHLTGSGNCFDYPFGPYREDPRQSIERDALRCSSSAIMS